PRTLARARKALEAVDLNAWDDESNHALTYHAADFHRHDDLAAALERLPSRQRCLLVRRFGLRGRRWTLTALARQFGCPTPNVHSQVRTALQALRTLFEAAHR